MTRVHRRRPNEAGYSLIEMMFTVGILGVLGSMAVISLAGARPAPSAMAPCAWCYRR